MDVWSQTLVVIAFGGLCWLVVQIHKNWDGGISARQKENERLNEHSSLWQDSAAQIRHLIREREKLQLQLPDQKEKVGESIIQTRDETELAWHAQAAELLRLISKQYKIDIDADWYAEYSTFLKEFSGFPDLTDLK